MGPGPKVLARARSACFLSVVEQDHTTPAEDTTMYRIIDTKTKKQVGKPWKSQENAADRVDKLNSVHETTRYSVEPMPEAVEQEPTSSVEPQMVFLVEHKNKGRSPVVMGIAPNAEAGTEYARFVSGLDLPDSDWKTMAGTPAPRRWVRYAKSGMSDAWWIVTPYVLLADPKK